MGYSLIYVDRWDEELQEPFSGGRCLVHVETVAEASQELSEFDPMTLAKLYGQGELVVVDDLTCGRVDHYLRERRVARAA